MRDEGVRLEFRIVRIDPANGIGSVISVASVFNLLPTHRRKLLEKQN